MTYRDFLETYAQTELGVSGDERQPYVILIHPTSEVNSYRAKFTLFADWALVEFYNSNGSAQRHWASVLLDRLVIQYQKH